MAALKKPLAKSRGDRVIAFIERYCIVPDGNLLGKPMRLLDFQKRFIRDLYDNPAGTRRAYLSIARKNGKTGLIAALVLAHLVGPEAVENTQIISGARSREQAAVVFELASKMVRMSRELSAIVRVVPSGKRLIGLAVGTEYRAISAEAGTAHGLSPVLAILDEVGQVKGPKDGFIEAIETSQGAHERPLLIAISTQAASDADLFSLWLDEAEKAPQPSVISHVYRAPDECALDDRESWRAANPALGVFRSLEDMEVHAARAMAAPVNEASFRWLFLNQRVEGEAPFVSRSIWMACNGPAEIPDGARVWGGLDLSIRNDLTAFVLIGNVDGVWHVKPQFWLPDADLASKEAKDGARYREWRDAGRLHTVPGNVIDYDFVVPHLREAFERYDVQSIAFDRWRMNDMRAALNRAGAPHDMLDRFIEFGQGFQSMSPALEALLGDVLAKRLAHGGNPLLTWCAANARVERDPAGNIKLTKKRLTGRIDGMVALAMAVGARPKELEIDTADAGVLFL